MPPMPQPTTVVATGSTFGPSIASASLPPVAAEAAERLMIAMRSSRATGAPAKADSPAKAETPASTASARDALADAYTALAKGINDPARQRYEVVLLALAAATLAEAHGLDRKLGSEPCERALSLAEWLLREWRSALRARVRSLLEGVVDGVALEGGRAGFVREVRLLLAKSVRWQPTMLDVDAATAIRFGCTRATYRSTKAMSKGGRALAWMPLAASNAEGRLTLLVADGRPPSDVDPSVVSRVTTAVRLASHGAVELTRGQGGRLRFEPDVTLTPRARRAAQAVRSLNVRPRRKRLQSVG